jgi:hypothetical protein
MAACSSDSLQSSISNMPTPSLILVPARFKTGKLYTPLATTSGGVVLGASGDFNVTRATTATRVNASGLIESVASGIPRLDYPLGGGCPALLVEPSSQNVALNSDNTATSWTLGANLSSGYVDVIGVSGNTLSVITSGSSLNAGAGRLIRGSSASIVSGTTYTFSFFMKKTGTHTIGAYRMPFANGDIGSGFNVSGSFSSDSLYNTGVTSRTRRIEQWGTDVYRCIETFTATASGAVSFIGFAPVSAINSPNNPAVGAGIAFAAPQLEVGSVATTFIPTTTAAVTRNADVISVSGAVSGCIGQTEGTIYVEVDIRAFNVGFIATISDGTASNRIEFYKFTGNIIYFDRISSTQSAATGLGSSALTAGIFKVAIAYKSGDTTMYINGTQVGAIQTQTFTFSSLTKINIGSSRSDGQAFNDRIRSLALYTTRLTNAELAALTTL